MEHPVRIEFSAQFSLIKLDEIANHYTLLKYLHQHRINLLKNVLHILLTNCLYKVIVNISVIYFYFKVLKILLCK